MRSTFRSWPQTLAVDGNFLLLRRSYTSFERSFIVSKRMKAHGGTWEWVSCVWWSIRLTTHVDLFSETIWGRWDTLWHLCSLFVAVYSHSFQFYRLIPVGFHRNRRLTQLKMYYYDPGSYYVVFYVQVLLNTAMYKGMKVTKTKKSITFLANIAGDGLTSVMIKVAANELQDLFDGVLALVPSSWKSWKSLADPTKNRQSMSFVPFQSCRLQGLWCESSYSEEILCRFPKY